MIRTDPTSNVDAPLAILPEPGEAAAHATNGRDADDLIAHLADEQIDALIAGADAAGQRANEDTSGQAALAGHAAAELASIASELRDSTAALVHDEARATGERIIRDEAPAEAREAAPVDAPVDAAVKAAIDVAVEPVPGHDDPGHDDPGADDAVNLSPPPPPSFNPPPQAEIERRRRRAEDAHAASSDDSAAAVARELAADSHLSPRSAAPTEHAPTIESPERELPSGAFWRVALRWVTRVPQLIVAAINLPVQPLDDRGREAIGAVAIVTLVNATALLLYLMMYAR